MFRRTAGVKPTTSTIADALELAAIEQAQWAKRPPILGLVADGTLEALKARQVEIAAEFAAINEKAEGEGRELNDEETTSWNALNDEFQANEAAILEADPEAKAAAEAAAAEAIKAQQEARRAHIAAVLAASQGGQQAPAGGERSQGDAPRFIGAGTESGDGPSGFRRDPGFNIGSERERGERVFATDPLAPMAATKLRDLAMEALDLRDGAHPGADQNASKTRLEGLLRSSAVDESTAPNVAGDVARRIIATGSDDYARAWFKSMISPHPMLTPNERMAIDKAIKMAEHQDRHERSIALAGTGGLPVPFQLDPTLIYTTSASVNPIRQYATIRNITGNTWKGVTTGEVAFTYVGEATAVTDGAPTLAQPVQTVAKAHASVVFTHEVGSDWPALLAEVAELLQRGKDRLEANRFAVGTQSVVTGGGMTPKGIVTAATTVLTATTATLVAADLKTLTNALGPDWRANARWGGTFDFFNVARGYDTQGGQWAQLAQGVANAASGQVDLPLLGKPAVEISTMQNGFTTTGQNIAVFGDFSKYQIVDRLGMETEYVPNLFDQATALPNGTRGVYAYFRNTADLLVPNAVQKLQIK